MMGGKDETSGMYFNDVWTIEPGTDTMIKIVRSAAWSPRHKHCVVRTLNTDTIYVIGGVSANGAQQDTWRSTDYGITFTMIASSYGTDGGAVGGPAKCISTAENKVFLIDAEGTRMKIEIPTDPTQPLVWTQIVGTCIAMAQPDFQRPGFSLTFMPQNRKIMLGGGSRMTSVGKHNDMWSSDDGGACFTKVSNGVNSNGFANSALVVLPRENGDEGLLLAVGLTSDSASEQYYSMDFGTTWDVVADLSIVGSNGHPPLDSSDSAPSVVVDTIFERVILGGGTEIFSASLTPTPFHCNANCAVRHTHNESFTFLFSTDVPFLFISPFTSLSLLSSLSLPLFTPVRNTPPPPPGPGVERAERHGDVKQHTHVIFAFHEFNASLPVSAITTTASIVKGGGEHYAKIYDAAHARDTVLCCNRRRTIRLRIGTRSTTFRKWIRDQIIRAVQDTHLITTSSFGGARKSRLTAHRSIAIANNHGKDF